MVRPTSAALTAATALALTLIAAPIRSQTDFCEDDGLIVFEVENAAPASGWSVETSQAGYTGASYYRWTGGNQFNTPGLGVLTYTLHVQTAGTYQLRIRNLHVNADITVENDCWTRLDGGEWLKTFSNINLAWTFSTWHEHASFNDRAEYVLSAGTHTFEISGRSNEFRIDRVHLYLSEGPSPPKENATFPETPCAELWEDLGNGLAGSGGLTPQLVGEGDLTDNAVTTLTLSDARASSSTYVVVGFSQLNAPFKFGIMVPNVDAIIGPFSTSPSGQLALTALWPAGAPSGFEVFWQEWVQDPVAPAGFSASNGLLSTTP